MFDKIIKIKKYILVNGMIKNNFSKNYIGIIFYKIFHICVQIIKIEIKRRNLKLK